MTIYLVDLNCQMIVSAENEENAKEIGRTQLNDFENMITVRPMSSSKIDESGPWD